MICGDCIRHFLREERASGIGIVDVIPSIDIPRVSAACVIRISQWNMLTLCKFNCAFNIRIYFRNLFLFLLCIP